MWSKNLKYLIWKLWSVFFQSQGVIALLFCATPSWILTFEWKSGLNPLAPLIQHSVSQCAPGVSNLDQKFHGLFHFCDIDTCKTVQNNMKKPSVNSLPKQQSSKNGFSILKMSPFSIWRHFWGHFYYRNFKIVGRLLTDGFFNWLWTVSHKRKSQKWKSRWNFWSRLETSGTHCVHLVAFWVYKICFFPPLNCSTYLLWSL